MLPYFRSSQGQQSWMAAMEAVLDAANLMQTAVDAGPQGNAHLMQRLGVRAVHDLSERRGLKIGKDLGVTREEFEVARRRLEKAGYKLRDAERSWRDFAANRREYLGPLLALAKYFGVPPAKWLAGAPPTAEAPDPPIQEEEET
jgi:hypothetical protein